MIRCLRAGSFKKRACPYFDELLVVALDDLVWMKGWLFGEGFGSRDAGFKPADGGEDPGDGGRFNLTGKGFQVEFHDPNNISVAIMQGGP